MEKDIHSDSDTMQNLNEDLENYKGVFYENNDKEEILFEYGAHFSYVEMYNRLEELRKVIKKDLKRDENSKIDSLFLLKDRGKFIIK